MTAFTFRAAGLVQGVGFRWSAQEEARRLGLAGWVCNDDDGAVSGFVQGEEPALEAYRKWLRRGPRSAKVTSLDWVEAPVTGLRIFTVRSSWG